MTELGQRPCRPSVGYPGRSACGARLSRRDPRQCLFDIARALGRALYGDRTRVASVCTTGGVPPFAVKAVADRVGEEAEESPDLDIERGGEGGGGQTGEDRYTKELEPGLQFCFGWLKRSAGYTALET